MTLSTALKTALGLSCISLCLTACTSISTNSAAQSTTATKSQAATTAPSYLYVISSRQASLKQAQSHRYVLSVNLSTIKQVIMFSDRPNRIIRYITGKQLKTIWSQGDNSFKVDPPNTVLVADHYKPHIVVMNHVKIHGAQIIFSVLSKQQLTTGTLHNLTLMIDASQSSITNYDICVALYKTKVGC